MKTIRYEWYGQPKVRFRLSFFEKRRLLKASKCIEKILREAGMSHNQSFYDDKSTRFCDALTTANNALRRMNLYIMNY